MKKLLLVIDVQNDFINAETKEYVNKIKNLIDSNTYDEVAFTKFINSKDSLWFKRLDYHGCMTKEGQAIAVNTKDYKIFEKNIYSAWNDDLKMYIKQNEIDEIYLCGFETDACVQKTAIDLFENGYSVFVLKDYTMTHFGIEKHNIFIENLKTLIGKGSII